MKIKYRKAKPQPPRHYWLDDCVVFCNKTTQCGSCKWLKEYAAYEKEKRSRKEKTELKKYMGL